MKRWSFLVAFVILSSAIPPVFAQGEAKPSTTDLRCRAHSYAKAITQVAELRDLRDQAARLSVYLEMARRDDGGLVQRLREIQEVSQRIADLLDTNTPAPRLLDPTHAELLTEALDQLPAAIEAAKALRDKQAALLAVSPEVKASLGKMARTSDSTPSLPERFLVFPLIISGKLDYYHGDADWALLRSLGFDTICPWAGAWGYRGPIPKGSVDDVIRDRVRRMTELVERNRREGFKTSIWIEPDDLLAALAREYGPEVYLHAADGTYLERPRIHNNANIWHPAVVEALESFLRSIGERFRDNPNVLCYELLEEPDLMFSPAIPSSGQPLSRHVGGYSTQAKAAFRDYLRARYASIDKLNTRYHTAYKDFDVVPLPGTHELPKANVPARGDHNRFRCESHAAFFAKLVSSLKAADPCHPVVPQLLPMYFLAPGHGLDPFLLSALNWDFYSTHDWPGQGPATETAFTYSVAYWADKPLWNEEYIWPNWVTRDAGEQAAWAAARSGMWRQFAWGKRALELFVWDGLWDTEIEGDWNNEILNRDSSMVYPRFAAGVFGELPQRIDELAPLVYPTEIVNDGLGVLVPTTTLMSGENPEQTQWWAGVIGDVLLVNHWSPLFVPESGILDGTVPLEAFRVIVSPPAEVLPRALPAKLLDWVAAGGTLIWQEALGAVDQDGVPLGQFDKLAERGKVILLAHAREAVHGKGRLVRYDKNTFNRDRDLLARVVAREYPIRPVYSSSRDHELVLRKASDGHLVLVVTSLDMARSARTTVSVHGRWPHVVDMTVDGGAAVPVTFDGDSTILPIRTGPGEGILFALYQSTSSVAAISGIE